MRVFLNEKAGGVYVSASSVFAIDGTKSAEMAAARKTAAALRDALPEAPLDRAAALCDQLYAEADRLEAAGAAAWGVDRAAFDNANLAEERVRDMAFKLREAGELIFGPNWYRYPEDRRAL